MAVLIHLVVPLLLFSLCSLFNYAALALSHGEAYLRLYETPALGGKGVDLRVSSRRNHHERPEIEVFAKNSVSLSKLSSVSISLTFL